MKTNFSGVSIFLHIWDRFLMISCYAWNVSISTGMWDCNMVFMNDVWLMDGSGRWLSKKANMCAIGILNLWKSRWWCCDLVSTLWVGSNCIIVISFYAGFLSLDVCCRPGDFQDYGLRFVWFSIAFYVSESYCACYLHLEDCCRPEEFMNDGLWLDRCSCYFIDSERSYSFSLFMVLPKWFYLIRFFKEKTFIVLAAISFYIGDELPAILDEIYVLDKLWVWLCPEVMLLDQDAWVMIYADEDIVWLFYL